MQNFINIQWHIDDVKRLDDSLTDNQARQVLQAVHNNHNADIGVNWDTINYWINEIKCEANKRKKLIIIRRQTKCQTNK